MVYDFLICTNAINYAVALALIDAGVVSRPWILVDFKRCDVVPRRGVRQWGLSVSRWRWIGLLLKLPGLVQVDRVFVPHHRLNHRASELMERARSVAFLDDGLDTRRFVPRNFDLGRLTGGEKYFTFNEYSDFPPWMTGFDICQITTLKSMCRPSFTDPVPAGDFDHVIIESPGCGIESTVQAVGADQSRVLVIRHPSPHKQQAIPDGYAVVDGRFIGTDEFIASQEGKSLYFGETMSFFIALALKVHQRNNVYLVLPDDRRSNLWGLPMMKYLESSNDLKISRVC
jgi:hypothetical protein